ncbi:MAG: TonB-dependent receptor, partial [Moraxellaceae bacterium]
MSRRATSVEILCFTWQVTIDPRALFPLPLPRLFRLRKIMAFKYLALTPISAALLAVAFSSSTMAADDKIETLIISATRSETVEVPVAAQIKVIDAEQIRVSGASTIAEVLRTQAGIQIQDGDGSGGRNVTVSMRGFSATAGNNTLILVDGRKLNNPSLAAPALNTIALNDIDRIEIIQGSAGVLYGDQAVGGVINVITKRAKAGELKANLSAQTGTDNLENYTANVSQGFENGLNYSLSAQKRLADNYRDNNESAITNVLGNVGFDFDGGRVFIESQNINDDLGLAGSLSDAQVAINPRQTNTPNGFSNQDTDLTRVGGDITVIDGWKIIAEYAD